MDYYRELIFSIYGSYNFILVFVESRSALLIFWLKVGGGQSLVQVLIPLHVLLLEGEISRNPL